jgi:hypothetical protein
MSKHDGCYVKEAQSAAFWAVDNGKRREMASMDRVYEIGLRPIHIISGPELEKIPIAGEKAKAPKVESDEEE